MLSVAQLLINFFRARTLSRRRQARLRAVASPDAGAWLHCLPLGNLGLLLNGRELRMAIGLRLGAPIVRQHNCVNCGAEVDTTGHHGLSCRSSAGRQRRHALANNIIVKAVRAAGVHAELEPNYGTNPKRPDGATIESWSLGKDLVWDFTCPDTLAKSHLARSAVVAGSAAARAEQNKNIKYAHLLGCHSVLFMPVAIETLGAWGDSARELCRDIGSRLAARSGDRRARFFLVQRLALAVQRGNAASVAGTFLHQDTSAPTSGELTDDWPY